MQGSRYALQHVMVIVLGNFPIAFGMLPVEGV
jgi:hypothetical protein